MKIANQKTNSHLARLRQLPPLLAFGCLTLPLTSAYAGGLNGVAPVVVHPVQHNISIPSLHSAVNGNISTSGSPISVQTGTSNNLSNTNTGQNSQASNSAGNHQTGQPIHSANNVSIVNQGRSGQTSIQATAMKAGPLPSGSYQLDLSSTNANIVLGSNLFAHAPSATISVGGTSTTFVAGEKVTAAEYVAIQQQLANNDQSLVLNAQGAADGGKFILNSTVDAKVTELVVPKGVTGLDFFSKNSSLAVAGDVDNYGSIYAVSTNKMVTAGTLSAADINNESGGIISTALPGSLAATISAHTPNVNLTLNATNNLTNYGTISSSGAMTLATLNGSISNNSGALVTASNNVNLSVGSGNLTNKGLIDSNGGQVSINSATGTDLSINAQGGTFQASGNINIGSGSNQSVSFAGGDLSAKQVNLNAPSGSVSFRPDQVDGVVNVTAKTAGVNVTAGNLELGNIRVSGDPNFSSAGNITIDGTITPTGGADMAIIAGGSIVSATSPGIYVLDTSSTTGNGGNLTLVAGANFTGSAPGPIQVSDSTNPGLGSATGGFINLAGGFGGTGQVSTITTSGSGSGNSSGYVELVAYAGTTKNSGTITLPTNVTVNATGTNSATNGDVMIIAGASTGVNSIITGNITANNVTLETFNPHVPSTITFTGGTSSAGITGFTTSGSAQTPSISTSNITAGGSVTMSTGGSLTVKSWINAGANTVSITSGGLLSVAGGVISGAQISLTAAGVEVSGDVSSSSTLTINTIANGNILETLGSTIGASSSIAITANGSGSIVTQSSFLIAPNISLASTSGNIGSASTPLALTNTVSLGVVTSGLVNITSSLTNGIGLGGAANSSSFTLSSAGPIDVGTGPTGSIVNLFTTANNANITVSGSVGGSTSTTTLSANGSGNIGGAGVINGAVVNLSSTSGNIGTFEQTYPYSPLNPVPVSVNAPTLSVVTKGFVVISDSSPVLNSVKLQGADLPDGQPSPTPQFSDTSNGNITINGAVGNSLSYIDLLASPTGTGMISGHGVVYGVVDLDSGSGGIFLNVNTNQLSASSTGGPVNVGNLSTASGFTFAGGGSSFNLTYAGAGPWSTNSLSTTSGNITLSGTGNLTLAGVTSSGSVIVNDGLNGGNANISINGNITANGTIALFTNGTGSIQTYSRTLTANTVNLGTTSGAIGDAQSQGSPVSVAASQLSVMTTGPVSICDTNNGVTLTGANTLSSFTLFSQGTITVSTPGLSSAAALGLIAQANNGGITLNNAIGGTNTTGGISLASNGSGIMQEPTNAPLTGGPINLTGGTGGIFLNLNTQSVTANSSGIVSLGNLSPGTLTVGNSTASIFSLGSNGSVTLNNLSATNGYLNVLGAGALVQVVPNAAISASNGSLNVENANTSSGSIEIGAGDFIHTTGSGNTFPVNITIGAIPSNPITGPSPGNVQFIFNGGTAYFGSNGISIPGTGVVMSLQGSNIVFNTGSRPASAITVNSNSGFIADPIREISMPSLVIPPWEPGRQAPFTGAGVGSPYLLTPSNFAGQSGTGLVDGSYIRNPEMNASGPEPHVATLQGVNSEQVAALNGEDVLSMSAPNGSSFRATAPLNSMNKAAFSNIPINTNNASALSINTPHNYWISDTELVSGKIPAILSSDEDFGIKSNVSMVVELSEEEQAAEANPIVKGDFPLSGSVSRVVRGTRELTLNRGSVVFVPRQTTIVHTSFGDVKIDARSVVLVMAFQHGMAVFDLNDTHGKAVRVEAGNKQMVLAPGTQVTITGNEVKSFEEINPAQAIGYGALRVCSLSRGLKAFTSEFSTSQSLAAVMPINQLLISKQVQAQKLSTHLLKTAAILTQIHNGTYEQIKRPELTAYSQP